MNLKLQLSKLVLWAEEIVFVGHLFTKSGVTADPEKVRAVLDMKTPETVGELNHFTCITGFLRPYIINFAHKMKPLADYVTEALKEYPNTGSGRTRQKNKNVDWNTEGLESAWEGFKRNMAPRLGALASSDC
jgi:hypothetical protein